MIVSMEWHAVISIVEQEEDHLQVILVEQYRQEDCFEETQKHAEK